MERIYIDRQSDESFLLRQQQAPLRDALLAYRKKRIVPFDVPGHKQGKGSCALKEYFGDRCVELDVNSSKYLDNLCHPVSVIKDAEALAAEAFCADSAFFMVNGTTSSVQAMLLSVLSDGDEIILPRNVHRSVINALVLCGAVPVYVNPGIHDSLGISLGMSPGDVKKAIEEHPYAKAVLVNNPTYYGICSDLSSITKAAHQSGMLVLCDEAHGTHFYFHEELPTAAMHAGADMAAVSIHKTGGSLTQSSMLLVNEERINADHVRTIVNLTQTTSASYLLLSSLDIARRSLALHGRQTFEKVLELAEYAREEINYIGGYYAFSSEITNHKAVYDFDRTKLSIHTLALNISGIEVYDILRDEYGIQIEFGDMANFLAIISVGDTRLAIERLVSALVNLKRRKRECSANLFDHEYISPQVRLSPKRAFYGSKESLPLGKTVGRVSAEFVTCYPPGIPVVAPGEVITKEILDYIRFAKKKGAMLTGAQDMEFESLYVLKGE